MNIGFIQIPLFISGIWAPEDFSMSSWRPYISLLWQVHTMEDHSVRSTCWLAWLLTRAFFLCTCSPVDHMSGTVCIYLSAHLKSFLPFPLFLDTWPQPTSGPPYTDSLCSFSSLVLPGMVWKEVPVSVDFPVETLGRNNLTCLYSLLLPELDCCLFFHMPLTFHAFCSLCLRCPSSWWVGSNYWDILVNTTFIDS